MYPNGIKFYREKADVTQQTLADALGIKREALSYYENGTRNPSPHIWFSMAEELGVNVEALMSPIAKKETA